MADHKFNVNEDTIQPLAGFGQISLWDTTKSSISISRIVCVRARIGGQTKRDSANSVAVNAAFRCSHCTYRTIRAIRCYIWWWIFDVFATLASMGAHTVHTQSTWPQPNSIVIRYYGWIKLSVWWMVEFFWIDLYSWSWAICFLRRSMRVKQPRQRWRKKLWTQTITNWLCVIQAILYVWANGKWQMYYIHVD